MLTRVLEPEVMDAPDDAGDYDRMDHGEVNRAFVREFLAVRPDRPGEVVDVGCGTCQIPIELARQTQLLTIYAVDAASSMLELARANIANADLSGRIVVGLTDARRLPFADGSVAAVVSNSIVHHVPEPIDVLREMARIVAPGGTIFVRDLFRPDDEAELDRLVKIHAAGANDHQRQLFADSLRAALTVDEMKTIAQTLGFPPETVSQTSDRHWTWAATVGESK